MAEYKIVAAGATGVGKSALVVRFVRNFFVEEYDPTIENLFRKEWQVDGDTVLTHVLDTASREAYISLRESYMRNGQGFMFCFSITSRSSFEALQEYADILYRVKDSDHAAIVLVGCKSDLESERQISDSEAQDWAHQNRAEYILTSAKDGTNIEIAFAAAVRSVKQWEEESNRLHPDGPKKDANRLQRAICTLV